MSKEPLTHCQICARAIKAKSGLIAHHGYQRPNRGSGWQTSSCFGARWRPYEVACDALPPAIKSAEQYRTNQNRALRTLVAEPPPGFEISGGPYRRPQWDHTVLRPKGFTADKAKGWPYHDAGHAYAARFVFRHYEITRSIESVESSLKHMKKRLADWKAPR